MAPTEATVPRPGPAGVPEAVACVHCGLPVPAGLVEAGAEHQFCCHGCRAVYAVLHEHGLEGYYDLARASAGEADRRVPAQTTGRGYDEFDDASFQELYCRPVRGGLLEVELFLEGVHCPACVWLVEKVPLIASGTAEARLDIARSVATVRWDPTATGLAAIARCLDSLGYPPHVFRGAELHQLRKREDQALLLRMGVAGAIGLNVMGVSFALYGGMFAGMDATWWTWFRWISLLVSAPLLFYGGDVFLRGAWGSLRARTLNLDVPIALGLVVGFVAGAVNTVRGAGEIYFDSLTVLVFLLLVGRFVQERGVRRAAGAAELLFSLTPSRALRVEGPALREVPIEALARGDVVEVPAGDTVPADGAVVEGESELDLAWLTGEARPAAVRVDDPIHAGAVNLLAPLRIRVEQTGAETRVGRLMHMVDESARRRAPVVQLADRVAAVFVGVVVALAAVTALIWGLVDSAHAVEHAVALLIVSCPCALALATPLAVSMAVGRAARAGILVKGGEALERLARPGRMWLDKTGTLTEGKVRLLRWEGTEDLKPLVRVLEVRASHPIARALQALPDDGLPHEVRDFAHTVGGGLEGTVDGRRLLVGAPAFASQRGVRFPAWSAATLEAVRVAAQTPVVVAADGEVAAVLGLGDALRPDAAETLGNLTGLGFRVGILSGDDPRAVTAVAQRLGIPAEDAIGGATPERKLAVVQEAAAFGSVVMVGDGVNDAAALSAATVGIGVHGGAEAGIAAADVFLTRPGLRPLTDLVVGARRTLGVIRRNLIFSLCYNVVGVTLAMTGVINPLIAAALMPLSSLTVVLSSYRARTFTP